jgi:hypothetical protein
MVLLAGAAGIGQGTGPSSGAAGATPPAPARLPALLARLEGALPRAQWSGTQQPWTPDMVRQVADLFGEKERALKVLKPWREGRSLVWTSQANPACQVALSVARFGDAAGARSYYGFVVDLQRKQDAAAGNGCTCGLRVLESRSAGLCLPPADEAVRIDKKIQFLSAKTPTAVTLVLARHGDLVVEVTWHGLAGDRAWTEQTLNAFFTQPR